jgi:hypothetical protein
VSLIKIIRSILMNSFQKSDKHSHQNIINLSDKFDKVLSISP